MAWRVESGPPSKLRMDTVGPQSTSDQSPPIVITPAPLAIWDQIYQRDPAALPTQGTAWAQAITAAGRFTDRSRLYTFADGNRVVLPLFGTSYPLGVAGPLWSNPSAWGFGGLLTERPLNPAELSAILNDLAQVSRLGIHIRPNPNDADFWQEATTVGWTSIARNAHVLDLTGGMDAVWQTRFKPRTRTAIRKAQSAGMDIECGRSRDLIDEFYALFEQSVVRWARTQREPAPLALWRAHRRDPVEKIHAMAARMGETFNLWIARHQGEAVAAILVLQDRNAHYTRGAMNDKTAGPLSANALLHFRAIEAACAAGCSHYHMGETGRSEALAQFKSRFGAVAVPYAEYFQETVPITRMVGGVKGMVKGVLGFKDV